jgi:hypothetical protein
MDKSFSRCNKEWSHKEIQYVLDNYYNTPEQEMVTNLNRSWIAIKHVAKKNKIKRSSRVQKRIYVDHNFFSEINLVTSYYAGLLGADGSILNDGRSDVSISLNKKDLFTLLEFAKYTKYKGSVRPRSDGLVRFRICGVPEWIECLENNFNVTSRKTFTLKPPNLSPECSLAYIKGYIDGDGGVYHHRDRTTIYLVGTNVVLSWIKDIFDELSSSKRAANVLPKGNVYQYAVHAGRRRKIFRCLKRIMTPEMVRKWHDVSPR